MAQPISDPLMGMEYPTPTLATFERLVQCHTPLIVSPMILSLSSSVAQAIAARDRDFDRDLTNAMQTLEAWPQRESNLRQHPEIGMTLWAQEGAIHLKFQMPSNA